MSQKQPLLLLAGLCAHTTLACDGSIDAPKDASNFHEIRLSPVEHPDACVTLVITVDLDSGASCETCQAADGSVQSQSCGPSTVVCDVITIPEPDCVVCAYVGGGVVYSNCSPEVLPEPPCPAYDLPPDWCFGGAILWQADERGCRKPTCVTEPPHCPVYALAPDFCVNGVVEEEIGPEGCPRPICRCKDGSVATSGKCTDLCDQIACAAVYQECPPGFHHDYGYPHCCGTCVPNQECHIDADCGSKQVCHHVGCAGSAEGTNPEFACFGFCEYKPTLDCTQVACAAQACPPGYETYWEQGACCPSCKAFGG